MRYRFLSKTLALFLVGFLLLATVLTAIPHRHEGNVLLGHVCAVCRVGAAFQGALPVLTSAFLAVLTAVYLKVLADSLPRLTFLLAPLSGRSPPLP